MADDKKKDIKEKKLVDIDFDSPNEDEGREDITAKLAQSGSLKSEKAIKQVNFKKVFLIILAVAVVAAIAIVCAIKFQPQQENTAVDNTRPATIRTGLKGEVARLEVNQRDGENLVFVTGQDGAVYYEADPEYPLNQTSIGSLLSACATIKADDTVFDDSSMMEACGLTDPAVTANVTYTDGSTLTIYLGNKTAKSNTYYMMFSGHDEIYEVFTTLPSYLTRQLVAYRNYKVFTAPDDEKLDEITYTVAGKTISLSPYADDDVNYSIMSWHMTSPYVVDINSDTYDAFVASMADIAFKAYVGYYTDDQLAEMGLTEPYARLYLHDTDDNSVDLIIGNQISSGEYYAALAEAPNDVFSISYTYVSALESYSAFDFVGSFIGLVNVTNVSSMEVTANGTTYAMELERQLQYQEDGKTVKTDTNGNIDYLITYTINGKDIEESVFKKMYQTIIGVTIDGAVPTDAQGNLPEISNQGGMLIVYHFLDGKTPDLTVEYRPYKTLYYAERQNDNPFWFMSTKEKVDTAIEAVETVYATGAMPGVAE